MGFCWLLCSCGFFLVVLRRWVFVGYEGQICEFGHARWRRHRFGRGLWVSPSMWPWAIGRGCGVGFFFLGLLGSECLAIAMVRWLVVLVSWVAI